MKTFYLSCLFLALVLPGIANAVPHVYWDPANSSGVASDASADPFKKTSPVLTWDRCVELGVMGDTIGLKQMSGDTPDIEVLRAINARKADRVQTHNKHEVIVGHGELPSEDIDESHDGGYRIRTVHVWEIFTAPNGQIAERPINHPVIVEQF